MRRIARLVAIARSGTACLVIGDEWVRRFLWFDRLLAEVAPVDGDVAECGVASGGSLAMLASLLRARGEERHLFGFDTWEGLPEPGAEDLGAGSAAARGLFRDASVGSVRRTLRAHGFDDGDVNRRVTLVRGRFADTLPRFDGRLALVHIDADLYESYRDALTGLWPSLAPGGVVAFDEYGTGALWPGAQRAVDEFVAELPEGAAELRQDERVGKWSLRKSD